MRTASEPLVSVVTPVHNEAEYLSECIESVLAQTYRNWDYTIVDNCSTDGTAEIARGYAAKESRIQVYENDQFLPAIANHNGALRRISPAAKYCKVVFGDDLIFPECLEKMVILGEQHPSVGLISAYCLEGRKVICTGLPFAVSVENGREICRQHLLHGLYLFGSANSVLYRADLVRSHDPFYHEANIHADTEVCFTLLKECDFGFVHQILTFTRPRPGSLKTISADLQTHFAGRLHILVRHGRDYLTAEEYDFCLAEELSKYYGSLSKSVFLGRDRQFWEYHRSQLVELGFGFRRGRLARATLTNLCAAALNPLVTFRRILGRRRKRGLAEADAESCGRIGRGGAQEENGSIGGAGIGVGAHASGGANGGYGPRPERVAFQQKTRRKWLFRI